MLRGTDRGTFTVPQQWTDHANPGCTAEPGPEATVLEIGSLLELLALTEALKRKSAKPK